MKVKQLTRKQQSSVACPTCGVLPGKRCILAAGGLRNEPQTGSSWLLRPWKRQRTKQVKSVPKKKESEAAQLARLRKELAKPVLTKSVRETATKKQIESWNAG